MKISSVLRVPVIWTSFVVTSQALGPLRITEPSRLRKNSNGRPALAVSQLCSVLFTGCLLKINNSQSFGIVCFFVDSRVGEKKFTFIIRPGQSFRFRHLQWIVTSRLDYFEWLSLQWVSAENSVFVALDFTGGWVALNFYFETTYKHRDGYT